MPNYAILFLLLLVFLLFGFVLVSNCLYYYLLNLFFSLMF